MTIGRPKVRTLLAVLALDVGRVVSNDRLTDALWGLDLPDDPHHALHMYVSRLRKLHPAIKQAVVTATCGYSLQLASGHIDAVRFERVTAAAQRRIRSNPRLAVRAFDGALAMWRGEALGDLGYKEFASGTVRRLEELRLTTIEDRYDAAIRMGAAAEVLPQLHQLAREHALRDRPIELLLQAMQEAGKHSDVRSAYREYCERLERDYGLPPSPGLRRLAASNGSRRTETAWA
jgi:DNA-binding SARP family transcriptional activator